MRTKAYVALGATVLIWASSFAVIKVGVGEIDPFFLAGIRAIIAAAVLLAVVAVKGELAELRTLLAAQWRSLALSGLVGIAVFDVLQNVGIAKTTSVLAGLLLNTNPLMIAALGVAFLRQRLPWTRVVGLLLGFAGMATVAVSGSGPDTDVAPDIAVGNLLVLLSALAWAVYSIITAKRVSVHSPLLVTCSSYVFGSVFSVPIFMFADMDEVAWTSPKAWAVVLYLGVVASALTFFMWGFALANLEVANASIVLFLIPVVAVLVGWLVLGEAVGLVVLAGGALILGGIALSEMTRSPAEPTPALTE